LCGLINLRDHNTQYLYDKIYRIELPQEEIGSLNIS